MMLIINNLHYKIIASKMQANKSHKGGNIKNKVNKFNLLQMQM